MGTLSNFIRFNRDLGARDGDLRFQIAMDKAQEESETLAAATDSERDSPQKLLQLYKDAITAASTPQQTALIAEFIAYHYDEERQYAHREGFGGGLFSSGTGTVWSTYPIRTDAPKLVIDATAQQPELQAKLAVGMMNNNTHQIYSLSSWDQSAIIAGIRSEFMDLTAAYPATQRAVLVDSLKQDPNFAANIQKVKYDPKDPTGSAQLSDAAVSVTKWPDSVKAGLGKEITAILTDPRYKLHPIIAGSLQRLAKLDPDCPPEPTVSPRQPAPVTGAGL